jgi:hypothetical protein
LKCVYKPRDKVFNVLNGFPQISRNMIYVSNLEHAYGERAFDVQEMSSWITPTVAELVRTDDETKYNIISTYYYNLSPVVEYCIRQNLIS